MDRLIVVGALKGAHGVRGEVRVKSFTAEPDALFTYGPLLSADGKVMITPKLARAAKDHFIVMPKEALQKEHWDGLRGVLLHVPRRRLPQATDDEFYVEDLIGARVDGGTEGPAGRVKSVQNFGAGELLEIDVAGLAGTVLVPFTLDEITAVHITEGYIVVPNLQRWSAPAASSDRRDEAPD